jgi:FG-GAP repeat
VGHVRALADLSGADIVGGVYVSHTGLSPDLGGQLSRLICAAFCDRTTDRLTRGAALSDVGLAWNVVVAADFDGDGKSDILWQHDSGLPPGGQLRREMTTGELW